MNITLEQLSVQRRRVRRALSARDVDTQDPRSCWQGAAPHSCDPDPKVDVHIPPSTPIREIARQPGPDIRTVGGEAIGERGARTHLGSLPDVSISATVAFQSLMSTSGESSTSIACNDTCGMNTTSSRGSCTGRTSVKRISACLACGAYRHIMSLHREDPLSRYRTSPGFAPDSQTGLRCSRAPSATTRCLLWVDKVRYRQGRCGNRSRAGWWKI